MCDGRSRVVVDGLLRHLDLVRGAEGGARVRIAIELGKVAARHVDADPVALPEGDRRAHEVDLHAIDLARRRGGWAWSGSSR